MNLIRLHICLAYYSCLIISQVWFAAGDKGNALFWFFLAFAAMFYGEWRLSKIRRRDDIR